MKRFKDLYKEDLVKQLQKKHKYANVHQIPRILKIVVNMGVGEAVSDSKAMDFAVQDLAAITGQKPLVIKAKKSIAGFKLREGMSIGCKVTLRKDKMYSFLERLVFTALPRRRHFRGFSLKNFDKMGNFNFGFSEQTVFPESNYDRPVRGLGITVVTTAKTDQEAKDLLEGFNIPFVN